MLPFQKIMDKEKSEVVTHSLITFTFLTIITCAISTVKAEETDYFAQQKLTSHLLINIFLEKLDDNRLLLFHHSISRTDLNSHEVSYVHNIADDSIQARLHFKLKKEKPLPGFEDYFIEGIVVEMDKDGKILEVSTHVSRQSSVQPGMD